MIVWAVFMCLSASIPSAHQCTMQTGNVYETRAQCERENALNGPIADGLPTVRYPDPDGGMTARDSHGRPIHARPRDHSGDAFRTVCLRRHVDVWQ